MTRRHTNFSEGGDTLIELLIAVVIISFTSVALLGSLVAAITGSTEHRALSVEETILKSSAETLKNEIQQQDHFVECEGPAGPDYTGYLPAATSGYTTPSIEIEWWNNVTGAFDPASGSCLGSDKSGIQLITLSVNAINPGTTPESLAFVVRNTGYAPSE